MAGKRRPRQRGLGAAGGRLWDSVCSQFELDAHESALLREACRTVDLLGDLQKRVDEQGVTDGSFEGSRMNPALREMRAQRMVLSRLMKDLKLPMGRKKWGSRLLMQIPWRAVNLRRNRYAA